MLIPKHKRQVMPQVGVVPSPIFPAPVRAAFGEQSARAQEGAADTGQQLAGLLAKHVQRKVKAENDRHVSELDTQFRISAQDFLFNQKEETYMKDGQKSTRVKGILNRNLSQAEGILQDFDSWYQKNRDNYLQNIQNSGHGAMLAQSMDSHYMSLRNNVIGHEVKQGRLNIETSLTANINQKISDGFMKQDPLSLSNAIEDIKIPQDALNSFSGYEKEVSELKTRATVDSLVGNAIQGALAADTTGTKATILLNSIKDKIHAEDYKEAEDVVKKQMKANSRLVEDDLLTKELLGELTIEEIFANSQPKEQGGIGPAKANTIKNRLLRQQKAELKNIQEDAEGAEEYIKLIKQVFNNQIDIFNAKKVMVDAFADGDVSKEEANKIKTIKENMQDMKWNKEEHGFINGFKSLVTFGKWQNTSTQELAVQTRELINAVDKQEDPEAAAIEILRNKYNSIHSGNPIGKDEDVLKRLGEEFDKALEVKKEENLSFDFNKLNPFAATEASAEEEDTEAPTRKTITKDTIYESLSLQEKLLSGDIGNKIIDIVSGGMTLQEADDFQRATWEGYADLPGDIWNLSISILQDVGEHIEDAKGFAMNPIGTINDSLKSKSKEELEALSERYGKANEPLLKVVGRIFEPIGRVIEGTRATLGEALEGKNVAEILEGGVKGFLKPEEVESLISKIPFREWEREGTSKTGAVVRLLPRAVAEAIETFVIAELTLGLPSKLKGVKRVYAEKDLRAGFNKMKTGRTEGGMKEDFTEWIASRGGFDKSKIGGDISQSIDDFVNTLEIRINQNPQLKKSIIDCLSKNQTFGKILKDKLASEVGTLKFSPEVAPLKSNLQAVAQFKMPGAVTAQQAIATLTNAGVTKEEIEFSGVEEFVKGKGKVTRDELVDYIEKNKVKVETVVKGQTQKGKWEVTDNSAISETYNSQKEAEDALEDWKGEIRTDFNQWREVEFDKREQQFAITDGRGSEVEGFFETEAAADAALEEITLEEIKESQDALSIEEIESEGDVKYSKYQLPGGENYQESLVTLPSGVEGKYKTSHWEEPNVLAHHRTNQRHDADGNTGTFIEEIQSDWHGEGKRVGYKDDGTENKNAVSQRFFSKNYNEIKTEDKIIVDNYIKKYGETSTQSNKVPNAPFKNTWHELAIKDIIRQAVERGDKFVAFISGEQTADRYDLSKHVSDIYYLPEVGKIDKYAMAVRKKDGEIFYNEGNLTIDDISQQAGKEIADKIKNKKGKISQEQGFKNWTQLSGLDLKVGGNWAKKFYDEILPQTAGKYIKQWGGKIEDIEIWIDDPTGIKTHPDKQKGFYITPQMVREISEVGQPLFGRRLEGSLLEKLKSEKGAVEPAGETPLPEGLEGKPEIFDALEDMTRETIPKFKSTNEAVAFGEKATPAQVKALKVKREDILKQNKEIRAKKDMTTEEMQAGMDLAVEGQFYREAIEASEGKIKSKEAKGESEKFEPIVKFEGKDVTALIQKSMGHPDKWEIKLIPKDGASPEKIIKDTYKEAMEEARERTGVLAETSDEKFVEHLKSMDKSGIEYTKKIEIEETGETVEIQKDVSEILRENSKTKSAYEQFLDCVSKL